MKNHQQYSHGLLYSVAPENISALRLLDEDGHDEFDWEAYELEDSSYVRDALNFMRRIVAKVWH